MEIFAPKELDPQETRTALIPASVQKLIQLGLKVQVEAGLGSASDYPDSDYEAAGAVVVTDRGQALERADMVVRVRKPPLDEVSRLKKGGLHISFLDPFNDPELLKALAQKGISTISLEMMPRTTLAQKMDALSSQANLAGYYAVILAAQRMHKILPMMMTAAGTLHPARFFIVGVGVAGLQAIATAKRLGARVEAFDTRPVVEEQVQSLGARFVKIDMGDTGETAQGYAKELTPEQVGKQHQGMARVCAQSDVIITTAKLFGRKAPLIITQDMVAQMKPGSLIVDLAVESGGNVAGVALDKEIITPNGVRILGLSNLEGRVAHHSSQMYSANLSYLIEYLWDKDSKTLNLDTGDAILKGCLTTHQGAILNPNF